MMSADLIVLYVWDQTGSSVWSQMVKQIKEKRPCVVFCLSWRGKFLEMWIASCSTILNLLKFLYKMQWYQRKENYSN